MTDPKDLGFVAPAKIGEDAAEDDVFTQLLETGRDDAEAVEPSMDDLGTLEEEWQRVCALKEAKDLAEERLKEAKAAYLHQQNRMAGAMERQGIKQFRGSNGGGCTISDVYSTRVTDEAAFRQWVDETHPELLTVNSRTRTSFVRNHYRDKGVAPGDPAFPPGLEAEELHPLSVRGARPNKETE